MSAADEIERLRADRDVMRGQLQESRSHGDRLRAALERIADLTPGLGGTVHGPTKQDYAQSFGQAQDIARAALAGDAKPETVAPYYCTTTERWTSSRTCPDCGYHTTVAPGGALPASVAPTIPEANDRSWLCFHCDERFTDREEARQHFGEMRTGVALCQEPRDLQDALRRARDAENRWMDLAAKLGVERTENERLAHMLASWERQFGTTNPRDAWNRLDSMEGRALAAEERLAAPPPPAPATEGKP